LAALLAVARLMRLLQDEEMIVEGKEFIILQPTLSTYPIDSATCLLLYLAKHFALELFIAGRRNLSNRHLLA
jgi:hypothetical protein